MFEIDFKVILSSIISIKSFSTLLIIIIINVIFQSFYWCVSMYTSFSQFRGFELLLLPVDVLKLFDGILWVPTLVRIFMYSTNLLSFVLNVQSVTNFLEDCK